MRVTVGRDKERLGERALDPILLLAASEMLQVVRYSFQLSGSPVKGTSGKNVLFSPAVTPRAGSRLLNSVLAPPHHAACEEGTT